MPYLTCPSCRFTVAAGAATSPFHSCPRCLLRDNLRVTMVATATPRRFDRRTTDTARIAEAKSRLSGPARGGSSA